MKPLPRIEGEVQRYQLGPDGDEWVKADDYAALNDYAALVQMERDSARAEVERLKADAERYQWMKRVHADGDESVTEWIGFYAADQWDEEIDRERLPFPTTAQRNEE